ncbi:MAG TPA: hypothetical protein VLG50_04910 [Candidatus Saccharimonadales bacterium]|nr:hypothetical protein [Candidatus Saccharimonadales bacterium]
MTDFILQGDLFKHHIIQHLNLNTYIDLSLISKYYNQYYNMYFNDYMCDIIIYRLKLIFGTTYDIFKLLMNDSGAIITGSFIIQCLLGVKWENTDIDVFVPLACDDLFVDFCKSLKIKECDRMTYDVLLGKIVDIKDYYINEHALQFITIDDTNMIDFINDDFDFDICKNAFYYNQFKPKIDIYDIKLLLYKFIFIKDETINDKRKRKYIERGFKMIKK